jgi:hypothetical protein
MQVVPRMVSSQLRIYDFLSRHSASQWRPNASLSDARIRVMEVNRKPLKLRKIRASLEGQRILPEEFMSCTKLHWRRFGFWRNYVRSSVWLRFRIRGRNYVWFRAGLWFWIWPGTGFATWNGWRWRGSRTSTAHNEYHDLSDARSEAADSWSISRNQRFPEPVFT